LIVAVMPLVLPFLVSVACAADPFSSTNPPIPPVPQADNALVQKGVLFEGDGQVWTPGQNQERTRPIKWHWKLRINKVDGEKIAGKWTWMNGSGVTVDHIEGTFTNGNKLTFAFTRNLNGGGNAADQGGEAVGTVSLQGEARFTFSRPNGNRLGEFVGTRSPPPGK